MPSGKRKEVIFSLQDGDVWISFGENPAPIRIGRQDHVTAAMCDFVAQGEVASRLLRETTNGWETSEAAE